MKNTWFRRRPRTPVILQQQDSECGVAALAMVLAYHGCWIPLAELRTVTGVSRDGSNIRQLRDAAHHYGFITRIQRGEPEDLPRLGFPCLAHLNFIHQVVVEGLDARRVYLNDPVSGPVDMPRERFDDIYTGVAMRVLPSAGGVRRARPLIPWRERLPWRWLGLAGSWLILAVPASLGLGVALSLLPLLLGARALGGEPVAGGMLLTAAAGLLAWLARTFALERLARRIGQQAPRPVLAQLQDLPADGWLYREPGGLHTRVLAGQGFARALASTLGPDALNALAALAPLTWLLIWHPGLGALSLGGQALHWALAWWLYGHRYAPWRRLLRTGQPGAPLPVEILEQSARYKMENHQADALAGLAGREVVALNAAQHFGAAAAFARALSAMGGALAVLAWLLVASGVDTPTALMLAGWLWLTLGDPERPWRILEQCSILWLQWQRAEESLTWPQEARAKRSATPASPDIRLQARALVFGYRRDRPPQLAGIDLDLAAGEQVGLTGAAGAGQSTLARLLAGGQTPWSGLVTLGGQPLSHWSYRQLAAVIALVESPVALFDGSLRDNLTLWSRQPTDPAQLTAALDDVALSDWVAQHPDGLDRPLRADGTTLSGGQRSRLGLARALVRNPRLLLLDEVFEQLEPELEAHIRARLRRRGLGVLIIAQRPSTLCACERCWRLEDGRLQAIDPTARDPILADTPSDPLQMPTAPDSRIAPLPRADALELAQAGTAVASLCQALGQRFRPPPDPLPLPPGQDALREIAWRNGLRLRRIRRWRSHGWRADQEPLLVRERGTRRPLVLHRGASAATRLERLEDEALLPSQPVLRTRDHLTALITRRLVRSASALSRAGLTAALLVPISAIWLWLAVMALAHPAFFDQPWGLLSGGLPGLAALGLILSLGAQTGSAHLAGLRLEATWLMQLQADLWERALQLPTARLRRASAVRLATLAEGLVPALTDLARMWPGIIAQGLWLLVAAALFLMTTAGTSPDEGTRVAIGLCVVLGLLVPIALALARANEEHRLQPQMLASQRLLSQSLHHLLTLRLHNAHRRRLRHVWRALAELEGARSRTRWLIAAQNQHPWFWPWLGLAGCLAWGALTPAGALALFALLSASARLGDQLGQTVRHLARLRRARALLHMPLECPPGERAVQPMRGQVELRAVCFRYPGSRQSVLNAVSMQVKPGEILAIRGPSGCGKTTLLQLILGLEHPQRGQVLWDGCPITALDLNAARRWVAYVEQNPWLSLATVRHHIAGMAPYSLEQVWEAAARVELDVRIASWTMGMQTLVDQRHLSAGEAQALQLARVVLKRPRLVCLDEATHALDIAVQARIFAQLRHFGITVILVTHRREIAALADRTIQLTPSYA